VIIAVGGQTRNVGKTTMVENIIRAFPEANWTAMKITQHGHGVCSEIGVACHCADEPEHPFALDEETEPSSTDSGRFLGAGAKRAFWLRTAQGELAYGLPSFRQVAGAAENLIVESNSLIGFVRPAVYLTMVDFSIADFKDSARRLLDRADALVVVESAVAEPGWPGVSRAVFGQKPVFRVPRPGFFSDELRRYLAGRWVEVERDGVLAAGQAEKPAAGVERS
jgi:hypothetical protein